MGEVTSQPIMTPPEREVRLQPVMITFSQGAFDAPAIGRRFERDAVVAGADVAIVDPHVARAVDVDAVVVGHQHVVDDVDAFDVNVVAAEDADGPERAVADDEVSHEDAAAVFEDDGEWPLVGADVDLLSALGDVGRSVAVEGAGTGDRDVLGIVGEDHDAQRRQRLRRFEIHRKRDEDAKVFVVWTSAEDGAAFEVELGVGTKLDRGDGGICSAGDNDLPAARSCASVDRLLNDRGVGEGIVAELAEVGDHKLVRILRLVGGVSSERTTCGSERIRQ